MTQRTSNSKLDFIIKQRLQHPRFVSKILKLVSKRKIRWTVFGLYLIGTDPICSSNFTQSSAMLQPGDVIQLSCTLVYGSTRSWPIDAVMTWSVNGQPVPAGNAIFSINNSPTEVTATSTLLISENFDSTYECATTFGQPPDLGPTYASNAPDYFKTCTISR